METEKKSNGALLGSIVIIIILIIGGIYIWQSKVKDVLEKKEAAKENIVPMEANELNALEQDLGTDTVEEIDIDSIN